jgi:GTP1/Obg family GTP-binding protein
LAYKNKDELENLLHKAGSTIKQTAKQVTNKVTNKEETPTSTLKQVAQRYKNPEELEKMHKQVTDVMQSSPQARDWVLRPASGKYTAEWFWKRQGPKG